MATQGDDIRVLTDDHPVEGLLEALLWRWPHGQETWDRPAAAGRA